MVGIEAKSREMRHATSLSGNHNVAATVTALGSVFDTLCYARTVFKKKKSSSAQDAGYGIQGFHFIVVIAQPDI